MILKLKQTLCDSTWKQNQFVKKEYVNNKHQ